MQKEQVFVECFGNPGFSVEIVAFLIKLIENPVCLRGPIMQRKYCEHRYGGGEGIVEGLQENMFPYEVVLSILGLLTGQEWQHYVYADSRYNHGVNSDDRCPMLVAAMQSVSGDEGFRGIILRNPPRLQSQPGIDHCHLLVPRRSINGDIVIAK